MHTITALTSQPWAITAPMLQQMLTIAMRENLSPEAVAAQLGRPLDNTRTVSVREGVAVIPVSGPIFRYANLFSEISGATSVEVLAQDFAQALADSSVRAILFEIDSPGGEVTGVHDLADAIYAARGLKPIEAYVEGMGASAAYWLASACDRITCEATALLGSVGVVMAVPDPAAQKAKDIQFVSSQSPNKRPDPTTQAGAGRIQAIVDATADVFIQAVARNRGMTPERVVADFDGGGLFVGAQAVAAGLADRVGTFEQCVADCQQQARASMGGPRRMNAFSAQITSRLRSTT